MRHKFVNIIECCALMQMQNNFLSSDLPGRHLVVTYIAFQQCHVPRSVYGAEKVPVFTVVDRLKQYVKGVYLCPGLVGWLSPSNLHDKRDT